MSDFNRSVIEEFRANGGRVAMFGDAPVVILHTIGARTGQIREIPLVAHLEDGQLAVFASKAGSPTHPDWYRNLVANPDIEVEFGTERFTAHVRELDPDAAERRLAAQAAVMPVFADYVAKAAPRRIPVLVLERR